MQNYTQFALKIGIFTATTGESSESMNIFHKFKTIPNGFLPLSRSLLFKNSVIPMMDFLYLVGFSSHTHKEMPHGSQSFANKYVWKKSMAPHLPRVQAN